MKKRRKEGCGISCRSILSDDNLRTGIWKSSMDGRTPMSNEGGGGPAAAAKARVEGRRIDSKVAPGTRPDPTRQHWTNKHIWLTDWLTGCGSVAAAIVHAANWRTLQIDSPHAHAHYTACSFSRSVYSRLIVVCSAFYRYHGGWIISNKKHRKGY